MKGNLAGVEEEEDLEEWEDLLLRGDTYALVGLRGLRLAFRAPAFKTIGS